MSSLLKTDVMPSFGGQTMVGRLRMVAVCEPETAGWNARDGWKEMGYLHAPDLRLATKQHNALCRELKTAGVEVVTLDGGGQLDAVYVHDASLVTDFGAICLSMGKVSRRDEPSRHRKVYQRLGIPILGEIRAPGTAEAGDMVWLDARTLLIGRGYRTNAAGIEQLRAMLAPKDIQVLPAPLPHSSGPGGCLHLMSLVSLLDEHTALVDLPCLAVETVELFKDRGYKLIEIDPRERDTLACNVLALGERRLLTIAENQRTNHRLRETGFDLRTFPAGEIGINGGGGPTCLTRPILREMS